MYWQFVFFSFQKPAASGATVSECEIFFVAGQPEPVQPNLCGIKVHKLVSRGLGWLVLLQWLVQQRLLAMLELPLQGGIQEEEEDKCNGFILDIPASKCDTQISKEQLSSLIKAYNMNKILDFQYLIVKDILNFQDLN